MVDILGTGEGWGWKGELIPCKYTSFNSISSFRQNVVLVM